MKYNEKYKNKIRLYLEKRFNLHLTEEEILECYQSFYYLGKTIYKLRLLKMKNKL